MKKHAPTLLAILVATTMALAGPIHTWSVGEVITSVDLNAALSHIHGTMVGGHGPRLVNSDVSGSAAIAHTKLAGPSLIPKVWANVDCETTPGSCPILAGSGVSSVTYSGTGDYSVNLTTARTNAVYGVLISSNSIVVGYTLCSSNTQGVSAITIRCAKGNPDAGATDLPSNSIFTIAILDDNN